MRLLFIYKLLILNLLFSITFYNSTFAHQFDIVNTAQKVSIFYDTERKIDSIAANLLAADIELVTGYRPITSPDIEQAKGNVMIIGSVNSEIIKQFAAKGSLNQLKGKWECYAYRIVNNPNKNIKTAFIICGSDFRGTAYGVFDLSARLGVSPWYWWADVKPLQQKHLSIEISDFNSAPPSVKYRGIFLNDEDWGLQPWAAKTFEPEKGDIGPKTYAKIFELLLRLKANLIWPAMHPSTKAFYTYPENKIIASDYEMVVGSSHAEPMLRNNVGEWDTKTMGDFNYITNKDKIYNYWNTRVKESKGNDAIYTMGMRGVHDSGLEGVKNEKEAVPLLEGIIGDQRDMLKKYVDSNVTSIPQVFTVYKEVLDIYDNNLKIPDDITIVWPDDNYGYIQRLNNDKENNRPGGSGVYYHASYWGRPHDYLWLSSTHPALVREEMMKAFETNSNKLWVLNVGDIKPLEYNVQMFLDMAYNVTPFKESSYTKLHLNNWVSSIFGNEKARKITKILGQYFQLAFERKPEFMGWSQTEPTTKTNLTEYNHFYYGDEAQRRIDQYNKLEEEVKNLRVKMKPKYADAFYELVYYPVVGASLINKKFLYRDKAHLYSKQNRSSAFDYYNMSQMAYDSIVSETGYYNKQVAGGKWDYMMSMSPRELPVYGKPDLPQISIDTSDEWSIAPEGFVTKDSSLLHDKSGHFVLPTYNRISNKKYFLDVFLSGNKTIDWTAKSNDWITLSQASGTLFAQHGNLECRIWVSIDWRKIPLNSKRDGQVTITSGGKTLVIDVHTSNEEVQLAQRFNGFIEDNGLLSIFAANYTRRNNLKSNGWSLVKGLGYAGQSLEALPFNNRKSTVVDTESIKIISPSVEYDFYNFTAGAPVLYISTLPTHPLNNSCGMRYAVSIDNGEVKIVDFKTFGRNDEWKQNVLRNSASRKIEIQTIDPGKHTLCVFMIDPGVILDRIVIDFGGLKKSYSAIPETKH